MTENNIFDISKHFKTPLVTLALPQKYIVLIEKIAQLNIPNIKFIFETVGGVLLFDSYQIFQSQKFGKRHIKATEVQHFGKRHIEEQYVEPFIEFKKELQIILSNATAETDSFEEVKEQPAQIILSETQLKTQINQLALSIQDQKLIKRISNSMGVVNTVLDIINIDPIEFSKMPAVGNLYVNQLIEFQKKLPDFLEKQTQKSSLFTENYSIEFNEIDNILIEDVEGYLWTLDEMKMDIAFSRWGFNQPHETLEELGKRHGDKTRARIGQIEQKINSNLLLNFRIQPKVLWANIREKMTDDLTELLPNLAKCFNTEKLFYEFVELCCQVESGSISEIAFAKISSKIINSFFCFNSSPISQEIIINELMSNYGHSKASAVNGLKQLAKNDRIEITAEGIYPKKLGKTEAVAHVLTFHPAGLPWKDIARIANKKSYLSTSFNEKVQATSALSDSEYVYLCGHGTYRNLMFLDLEQFNIPEIMQHLLDYFEQHKLNALHLHDYYQQNKIQRSEIEYFTLRHIVRGYGEEYGIFFNGKSGADSVSLNPDAKQITQSDVIVKILQESKVAMTKQEIAEFLKSKSTNHATFLLNVLMEEGSVIRVDHIVYTTPEKAFSKINVDAVMQIIKNIMNAKNVIVEADVFREYVNIELNLSYSKYIYAALVRTKLNELGWYRSGTLFSKMSIPYKSLADMYDQLCNADLSNSENIQNVQKVAWLTNAVAANALQWWKFQRKQANDNLVGEIE
jgi:hypothetical protein